MQAQQPGTDTTFFEAEQMIPDAQEEEILDYYSEYDQAVTGDESWSYFYKFYFCKNCAETYCFACCLFLCDLCMFEIENILASAGWGKDERIFVNIGENNIKC